MCINVLLIWKKSFAAALVQRRVLLGIALGNNMCNCLVAVMSTQAITLLAQPKVNTSDCEERVGVQEMQVLALAITR